MATHFSWFESQYCRCGHISSTPSGCVVFIWAGQSHHSALYVNVQTCLVYDPYRREELQDRVVARGGLYLDVL